MEDFDVEMPESVDDELLTENGLDMEASRPGKCLHEIDHKPFDGYLSSWNCTAPSMLFNVRLRVMYQP